MTQQQQFIGIILVGFAILFTLDILPKLGITNIYVSFVIVISIMFLVSNLVGNRMR